jgi:hypothetical protein
VGATSRWRQGARGRVSPQGSGGSGGLLRQGDVLLVPVRGVPSGGEVRQVERVGGRLVLAEGEATGHAHAVVEEEVRLVTHRRAERSRSGLQWWESRRFLVVAETAQLVHEEHDAIAIPAGTYEVRRQREYAPEVLRRARWVAD